MEKNAYVDVGHRPKQGEGAMFCLFWILHDTEDRLSCQNKFVKLVHLVGFIIKKFVMMQHGQMNVKLVILLLF